MRPRPTNPQVASLEMLSLVEIHLHLRFSAMHRNQRTSLRVVSLVILVAPRRQATFLEEIHRKTRRVDSLAKARARQQVDCPGDCLARRQRKNPRRVSLLEIAFLEMQARKTKPGDFLETRVRRILTRK